MDSINVFDCRLSGVLLFSSITAPQCFLADKLSVMIVLLNFELYRLVSAIHICHTNLFVSKCFNEADSSVLLII